MTIRSPRAHTTDAGFAEPASTPSRIILMRHGEKTNEPGDRGLSARGTLRALGLATALPQYFGPIRVIVAAKSTENSERPAQTVAPLAQALGLTVDQWVTDQYAALAQKLETTRYNGDVVICWRHKTLQQFANALGADYPAPWPETEYERICLFTILESGTVCREFRAELLDREILIRPCPTD